MAWFRVDNRLIHGQIIETWLPYLRASKIIVANDAIAGDILQQQIMQLAIPKKVTVQFIRIDAGAEVVNSLQNDKGAAAIVIVGSCRDAQRIIEQGGQVSLINIGNLHYAPGKKQVCAHVAISEDDAACLQYFEQHSIALDFRGVPGETPEVKSW